MKRTLTALGRPIQCSIFLDERFAVRGGKLYLYTTGSGSPCVLNIYNVTDDVLEAALEMPGSLHCWSHGIAEDGTLYIAPMDSAKLFRYSPETKVLEDLGSIFGQVAAYQVTFDERGCVYLGTYPSGSVVRYDPKTGIFYDYGQVVEGHKYVRSLAYDRGFLYAGTAAQGARIVKIDSATGAKEVLPLPEGYDPDKFDNFYTLTRVGRLLFSYTYYADKKLLLAYQLDEQRWLPVAVEEFGGLYVSPPLDGKAYFCANGEFHSIDLATHVVENTGIPSPQNGKGFGIHRRAGDANDRLLAINHSGNLDLLFVDFERKHVDTLPLRERLQGGYLNLHALEAGPNRSLYMGAYMSGKGCIYQVDTGEFHTFPVDQTEGMAAALDCMYFGVYPGGRIYRHAHGETELLRRIGNEQDRPFAMLYAEGTLFIGTIPDYNRLGGALTSYTPAMGEWEVDRNIIPNQSITGLAYSQGLLYGGSGIWGGLGIEPTEHEACLFVWDIQKRAVIRAAVPTCEGLTAPIDKIGGIALGPDGLLWCVGRTGTNAVVFAAEPQTLQVQKHLVLHPRTPLSQWRPSPIRFHGTTLYVCIDGILAVDIQCMALETLTDEPAVLMAFGADERLYYSVGPALHRIEEPLE